MSRLFHLPAQPIAHVTRRAALAAAALLIVAALAVALPHSALAQEGISVVYIVQPGDTLSSIAAQYDVDADSLITINNLKDANSIVVGQKLQVPITGLDPSQPAPASTYRVQAGETLSAIAVTFGLSIAELMSLNDLSNADAVFVGQLLRVGRSAVPVVTDTPEPAQPTPTVDTSMLTAIPTQPAAAADANSGANAGANAAAVPELHTVQPGETLTGIARAYNLPVATLKALNNLGDADFIVVGQTIRLSVQAPNPAELAATATPTPAEDNALASATATPALPVPANYTVQVGDTLSGIAQRYGIDPETLKALNGIQDENSIYSGQTLILSALAAQAQPTATAQPSPTAEPQATDTPEPADTPATAAAPGATLAATSAATTTATTTAPAAAAAPAAPITRSGNAIASLNQTVKVRFGDTLGRIALRTGVDADALRQLNNFDSLNAPLNSGQTLLLPATDDELHPQTPAQQHVVKPGESFGVIAQAYGLTNDELLAANRIADPNSIYPGQTLLIPSPATAGEDSVQIGPASSGFFYYTVQPNDTLSAIAQQFGSTMEALRTYNGLPDNETVYTGLDLKIPYGAPELPVNLPPVPMSGTRFVVSLSRQQCWVFEGDKVRYAWNCSTGIAERKTKPGNYHVQSKIPNAKSRVWRLDMPYWLGIYDVGTVENGIHGLPLAWRTGKKIWEGLIGQPATFGCAMLDDANAATLYKMAFLGMPVHIVN